MSVENNIDYHSGMISALKATYDDRYDFIETVKEVILGEQPPRLDAVVLKKKSDYQLTDSIGCYFKEHNVIEFKGVGDGASINDFFKVQAYAILYMTTDKKVNEIPHKSITITVLQYRHPRELFKFLEHQNCSVTKKFDGIYEITGKLTIFPFQIINIRELNDEWAILKIIASNASVENVIKIWQEVENAIDANNDIMRKHLIDVLQISTESNEDLFKTLKGGNKMRDSIARIFKDEIEEATEKNNREIAMRMLHARLPIKQITNILNWPREKILNLADEIGIKSVQL